jgi:hypothetical protein
MRSMIHQPHGANAMASTKTQPIYIQRRFLLSCLCQSCCTWSKTILLYFCRHQPKGSSRLSIPPPRRIRSPFSTSSLVIMTPVPGQSSYLRTVLNFPLVEESPAASLPFRLLDLPSEVRNMTYAYSAVPPSGRALGRLDVYITKDHAQQHSCPISCLCSADEPCYCAEQRMYNEFGRSMYFMREYAEC